MRIQALADDIVGDQTVFIVGTGPSLRVTPLDFLKGRLVVGLNQAWKYLQCDFTITIHPELYQAYCKESGCGAGRWIIKKKPPMANLELDDEFHYVFGTSYDIETVAKRPKDTLYLGEGVQSTAMDLAARMGAKTIVLVGCDAGSLEGDFHGHDQHVRWVGRTPDEQYKLYRDSTAEVREALRPLGVSVLTLSPFIGANSAVEDYRRLKDVHKLAPLPAPKDISPPDWKPPERKKK